MSNLNSVNIIGNLTRDPEVTTTAGGLEIGKFSIALNGRKEGDVSYIDITVFDKLSTLCAKYLKKGSSVGISGSLKQERWKDKEGNGRSKIHVIANNVQFLTSKSDSQAAAPPNTITNPIDTAMAGHVDAGNEEDIPF